MAILGILTDRNRRNRKSTARKVVVSIGRPDTRSYSTAQATDNQGVREEASSIRKASQDEAQKIREQILEIEKRIVQKEESLDARITDLQKQEADSQKLKEDLLAKLQKVANLTLEEAKKMLLETVNSDLKDEIAKRIKEAEEEIKASADAKAKEILVNSMIAGATDWVAEYTVSVVKLESDEIKGRIIGKEGRNIRAFELTTGVDVELDSDVANEVRLSSFDPVRREIARIALEWLVKDARIQPTKIEQLVDRAKQLVARDMSETGRKATYELGLYNLSQEAQDTLGRLKFRYSYGQNQLIAALETGKIAKKIAQEVGANSQICATGGLFHDIGKTQVDREGTHVQLGVELAKKWNFDQRVIDCIAQHHEDEPFTSVESIVVHLADAVSGARPGARHEAVEDYMKRLSEIEKIATSFTGVDKAYAIQAGREIRVIVKPDFIDDAGIVILSHEIKQRLEKELTYPGQIVVTVIRETRAVDVAK